MDYHGDRKKWREVDGLKYPFGGGYVDFLVGLDVVVNREKKQDGDCIDLINEWMVIPHNEMMKVPHIPRGR